MKQKAKSGWTATWNVRGGEVSAPRLTMYRPKQKRRKKSPSRVTRTGKKGKR